MKKSLLFALAALAVMSADAQVVSRAKQARQVTPIAEQPVKIERGAIRMQVAQHYHRFHPLLSSGWCVL